MGATFTDDHPAGHAPTTSPEDAAEALEIAALEPRFAEHSTVLEALADEAEAPTPDGLLSVGAGYLGVPETAPVTIEAEDPATEFRRLYTALGVPMSDDTERSLERLDELPASVERALAHLAWAQRYAHTRSQQALQAIDGPITDRSEIPWAALVDASRAQLSAVQEAAPVLEAVQPQPLSFGDCGAVMVDMDGSADRYECDLRLSIDVGGDDVYENNAGGTGDGWPAAMALDLGGGDTYTPTVEQGGHVGGAQHGVGLLYEASGDDRYRPTIPAGEPPLRAGVNGGASVAGVAVLIDQAGNDVYTVEDPIQHGAANGGSNLGLAVLYDADGDDVQHARFQSSGGASGGTERAVALMYDGGGADVRHTNASSHGVEGGFNGGASSGLGVLIDRGDAPDTYRAEGWDADDHNGMVGINGGSLGAETMGILVDEGGDDRYHGVGFMGCGINGGGVLSGGALLVDHGGDDDYTARCGKAAGLNGGGARTGNGLLLDDGGDDRYEACVPFATQGAANGAGVNGIGGLVDTDGRDVYVTEVTDALTCGPGETEIDESHVPSGSGARLDLSR